MSDNSLPVFINVCPHKRDSKVEEHKGVQGYNDWPKYLFFIITNRDL